MFNQMEALLRRITALEKKVQQLEDNQIKQNRDYKDAMYNLDADNVPAINGIYKEIKLISETAISLAGKTIDLTADKIKITSDNFSVDDKGHVEMGSADIKHGCVLGSDIEQGTAMRIGPAYRDDNCSSNSAMGVYQSEDGASGGYTRGVVFSSVLIRGKNVAVDSDDVKAITGDICADAKRAGASLSATTVESPIKREKAFVGLERADTATPSDDFITAKMQVGEHAIWIDSNGNLCTTATALKTGQQMTR